jgi:hypothetical protein
MIYPPSSCPREANAFAEWGVVAIAMPGSTSVGTHVLDVVTDVMSIVGSGGNLHGARRGRRLLTKELTLCVSLT